MARSTTPTDQTIPEEDSQPLSEEAELMLIQFGENVYQQSGLDATTARSYLRSVTIFIRWREAAGRKVFQPHTVTPSVIRQYIDHLHQVRRLKRSSVQGQMTGLRYYFNWLLENNMLSEEGDPTKGVRVPRLQKSRSVYNQQIAVRMTTPMYNHLRTLTRSERDIPAIVREAIRNYLDEQADLAGSKRSHAEGMLSETDRLGWYLTLLTILIAQIGSMILMRLAGAGEDLAQLKPAALLGQAHDAAIKSGLKIGV